MSGCRKTTARRACRDTTKVSAMAVPSPGAGAASKSKRSLDDSSATDEATALDDKSILEAVLHKASPSKKLKVDSAFIDETKKPEAFRNYGQGPRYERVRSFYEEQHSKQTYDFAVASLADYGKFDKCTKTVWEMVQYLAGVVDDSDPDTDLSQLMHAIQTGEAARALFPGDEFDWFHVTAFIHDLGKILAVKDAALGLRGEPQWSVVGDNYPMGCAFDKSIVFYDYFAKCPDFDNPKYNSKLGIYKEQCGLEQVTMSWSHDEYLYRIAKAQSSLPKEALYILRFHSCYAMHQSGAYRHLMNDADLAMLPWIQTFQKCDLYSKSQSLPPLEDVAEYYKKKIDKYFPKPVNW